MIPAIDQVIAKQGPCWRIRISGWMFLYPVKKFSKTRAIEGAIKQFKHLERLEKK